MVCTAVAPPAVPTATTGEGGSARVAATDAMGIVVASATGGKTLMSDDTKETVAAKAELAVAPSSASTCPSEEGGVAGVPAVGAAIAVALSAARRRMYERKEDMRSAVGGGATVGLGSVSTSMPVPAAEAAVAVAPAAVPGPRGGALAVVGGRPSETEVMCTLGTRAGRPSETEAMGLPGARVGISP